MILDLLALTDTQFDKVLLLVTEILMACQEAIQALWAMASPLLLGLVALQLARYQQLAREARKTIVEKIEEEANTSKKDRAKIIDDLQENTKISEEAFKTANGHNEKIAAVVKAAKLDTPPPTLPPMP